MVEDDGGGEGVPREDAAVLCVIGGPGSALCRCDVDGGHRVVARVACGVRVGVELFDQFHVEAGLFLGLPYGGCFQGFTVIDEAAGKGPSVRRVDAFDKDDSLFRFDDRVHGEKRVPVFFFGFSQFSISL